MSKGKLWQAFGIIVLLVAGVAFWSQSAIRAVSDSAEAIENAANSVQGVISALDSIDAGDVDSLRAEGVELGGAIGASMRAVWDTLTAADTTGHDK